MFPARKTARMSQVLFERKFIESKEGTHLNVAPDKRYLILNGLHHDFQSEIIVSIGEEVNSREIIRLDPKSDLLIALYNDLKKELKDIPISGMYVYPFIARTMEYVRKLFKSNKDEDVAAICTAWQGEKYNGEPIIPLNEFILKKVGICRHYALLTCYLLDRLVKDGMLKNADVYLARGHIKGGGSHAWAIFHEKNERDDAYLVDAMWHDVPFFIRKQEDELNAYGHSLEQCKVRYLTPSAEYFKQLNPPGVELIVDTDFAGCIYKEKKGSNEIYDLYIRYGEVGNGSYGSVFEMRPMISEGESIAIKQPKINTAYPQGTPDEFIKYDVMSSIQAVARELPFTRALNGIGATFCTDDPIVITIAADGSKTVGQYPHFYLAMKYLRGTLLAGYKIKSLEHFRHVVIAILEELRRVHDLNIILEDIKNNNVKILEERIPGEAAPKLVAQLFDHTLSQFYSGHFSIAGLELNHKPTDFKANFATRKIIRATFEDDIFCVGLMLTQCYSAAFNNASHNTQETYAILATLSLMTHPDPALRIGLDEILKSFREMRDKTLNCEDLTKRIKASGKRMALLFAVKFNIIPAHDRERFLNFLGLDFFKKIEREEFAKSTEDLSPDARKDLAIFLLQSAMTELEKKFPDHNMMGGWCYCESVLDHKKGFGEDGLKSRYFFTGFLYAIQNDFRSFNDVPPSDLIKENILSVLQKLAPENRKSFLLYVINSDWSLFKNLLALNKIEEFFDILPAGEDITTLFKSAVKAKQKSFEVADESYRELDRWLYCEDILFSLDQPLDLFQCNTVEHQLERLRNQQDDDGVECFRLKESCIERLIPALKRPFPKNKISLLMMIGIEKIKQFFPCDSAEFLDLFAAIPENQQARFFEVMDVTFDQAASIAADRNGFGRDASRLQVIQNIMDFLSESQLADKLEEIKKSCSREIDADVDAGESKKVAVALDKWLFISCVTKVDCPTLSDYPSAGKSLVKSEKSTDASDMLAAINLLEGPWKLGEGRLLFFEYVGQDLKKLHSLMLRSTDQLSFLQSLDPDVLRKMLRTSEDFMLIFGMLSMPDRRVFLKIVGLEFLKSIHGLPPSIFPSVEAVFGFGKADFLCRDRDFALQAWEKAGSIAEAIVNVPKATNLYFADRPQVIFWLNQFSDDEKAMQERSSYGARFFSVSQSKKSLLGGSEQKGLGGSGVMISERNALDLERKKELPLSGQTIHSLDQILSPKR